MSDGIGVIEGDERRLRGLRKLTDVSRALTYATSRDEVLRLAVEWAVELIDAEKSVLLLADPDGLLKVHAAHGIVLNTADPFAEPVSETIFSRLQDLLEAAQGGVVAVPLVMGQKVAGILAVGGAFSGDVDREREWLLSALADQAAVALEKTRLDEATWFRETFIGIVGHDLRNPLSAIQAAADMLLLSDDLGEKDTRLVRRIATSVARMAHIIDELLDFTRARLGGGITLKRASVDIHKICRGVMDELSLSYPEAEVLFDPRASGRGNWDSQRLAQVVSNLLTNAVVHGADAPIELRSRDEGDDVVVEVHNQGSPIPGDLLPHIFDPFRGALSSRASTGVGLGLYISQEIIRAHRGDIAVRSSADEGTTFTIHLPRE